jgi:hypothetical protein
MITFNDEWLMSQTIKAIRAKFKGDKRTLEAALKRKSELSKK